MNDAEELGEAGEERGEGHGLICFVEVSGGGEPQGERGDVVLDQDGEVGVAGTGGGLDPKFFLHLTAGSYEGVIEGDAAGLTQGGEGDGAIGGGLSRNLVENVCDLVTDFACFAWFFGTDL